MPREKFMDGIERIVTYLIRRYVLELPEAVTLESDSDFIYLSDMETYELYLMSAENSDKINQSWKDYKGKKCYEALQKRTSPCPFCTNSILEKDMDYIWKFHNDVADGDYILKDRIVNWNGKMVRMETVIDVSNLERMERVILRSLGSQNLLAGCSRLLLRNSRIDDICAQIAKKIGIYFRAEESAVASFGQEKFLSVWKEEQGITSYEDARMPDMDTLASWRTLLGNGRMILVRPADMEEIRSDNKVIWNYLRAAGIESFVSVPIIAGKQLLGMISLYNVRENWPEVSMLTMLAGYLSSLLERNELEHEKEYIKYYDTLTGCLNFEGFRLEASRVLKENKKKHYALWYCDIKNFKYINDVFGYDVGDQLLIYCSQQLRKHLSEESTFCRISADKFSILIPCKEDTKIDAYFQKMHRILGAFEPLAAKNYETAFSVGVYLLNRGDSELNLDEMLNRANMAQKSIKKNSGSHYAVYDEDMRRKVIEDMELEAAMRGGMAGEKFVLYYQPQESLQRKSEFRAEALVRWDRGGGIFLMPGAFIPLFEQDGLIVELDRYVFEHACRFAERSALEGWKLCLAVNVSRISMLQPDFVEHYRSVKQKYGISDGVLELEFTEDIVVENLNEFMQVVVELHNAGFRCAMDDFGTCQSSLNVLKSLPIDVLKIDRQFFCVGESTENRGKAVVNAIVQMSGALEIETVAEGVESETQAEVLKDMGCDFLQGFVYEHPMPEEQYICWLRDHATT